MINKYRKGFSLIELLVTVSILAIIAAIAVPAYLQYTNKAKVTAVVNGLEAIAKEATSYRSSKGSWPTTLYGSSNASVAFTTIPNVTNIYYGFNASNAWIGFKTDTTKIPSGSNGWIFYVARISGDTYSSVCGQWQASNQFDFGDTNLLPAGCNLTNVASLRLP